MNQKVVKTTWDEMESLGCEYAGAYCRLLMKQSVLFADARLEVYRGDMLCMTFSTIAENAKLRPNPAKQRYERWKPK